MPGAIVTITKPDTGLRRSAKTDDLGRFNFPQLKPGTYSVKVEAPGFEPRQKEKPDEFSLKVTTGRHAKTRN